MSWSILQEYNSILPEGLHDTHVELASVVVALVEVDAVGGGVVVDAVTVTAPAGVEAGQRTLLMGQHGHVVEIGDEAQDESDADVEGAAAAYDAVAADDGIEVHFASAVLCSPSTDHQAYWWGSA